MSDAESSSWYFLPRRAVTILYWLKYRCQISPCAEVDYTILLQFGPGTRINVFAKLKARYSPLSVGKDVDISNGSVTYHVVPGIAKRRVRPAARPLRALRPAPGPILTL